MRVHVVDPSAYTPPYDHALCAALAAAGAEVELYTSRFTYGEVPVPEGYVRREHFYRLAHRAGSRGADTASGPRPRALGALKLLEHGPDMLRYRRAARAAQIVHFEWLSVQPLDLRLLPPRRGGRALVITAHDILPREPRRGQLRAQRRLYDRFDAIVVHSEHGRRRLTDELGLDGRRVHVIRHGVLTPRGASPNGAMGGAPPHALPAGFGEVEGPVALFFGLLRPYKGLDVLLEAWQDVPEGELWIVGMPRMDTSALHAAARSRVRFLERFVSEAELGALLARASLAVLPYREIDASGAAFTAIGAGLPLLLSDAGGFPEIAASGCARTVPAEDAGALGEALRELLGDSRKRGEMAERARAAAAGPYAWEGIGASTLSLYETLLRENPTLVKGEPR
jgi:glycosyltransferase involved in cell wall biosynthesis